jgi:hypothetical protein
MTEHNDDRVKHLAIEILRLLAIYNIEMCCWSGGFTILCDTIIDTKLNEKFGGISKKLTYTIIYL